MTDIIHSHYLCPLRSLDVKDGVEPYYAEGIGLYLSVGVVNTDFTPFEILAGLSQIRSAVRETCSTCKSHINNGGSCKPGGIFKGGMFFDLVVAQRDQFPEEIKNNPECYYSDF